MTCSHNFFPLRAISRPRQGGDPAFKSTFLDGLALLCADCGEYRAVYEDGRIFVRDQDDNSWEELTAEDEK